MQYTLYRGTESVDLYTVQSTRAHYSLLHHSSAQYSPVEPTVELVCSRWLAALWEEGECRNTAVTPGELELSSRSGGEKGSRWQRRGGWTRGGRGRRNRRYVS